MQTVKRVLVIDDEPDIRLLISDLIETPERIVRTASDGIDALNLINEESFDLIISDYSMPRLNGLELVRCLREAKKSPEIIWLTGCGSRSLQRDALKYGVFDYFEKPIKPRALCAAVSRAISSGGAFSGGQKENFVSRSLSVEIPLLLESRLAEQAREICKREGKSLSQMVEEMIQNYQIQRDD